MNKIFDNPAAFAPFYDSLVSINGNRRLRTIRSTFRACVIDQGFEDPLSADGTGSTRCAISVRIRKSGKQGWNDVTPPQVGDVVTHGGVRFNVFDVELFDATDYILKARQAENG